MIRNAKHIWPVVGTALFGLTLAGCGGNNADNTATTTPDTTTTTTTTPDTSTNTGTSPSTTNASTGTTSTGTASAASFKGAAATWSKITTANAALDKVIKSNKLSQVHEAAFALRDIVKTLPAQSQALSPDKQKTLATQVKNVEQLAGKLDEAGDSNNLAATKDNQAGMNDALDIIKGLYPAGALK